MGGRSNIEDVNGLGRMDGKHRLRGGERCRQTSSLPTLANALHIFRLTVLPRHCYVTAMSRKHTSEDNTTRRPRKPHRSLPSQPARAVPGPKSVMEPPKHERMAAVLTL